MTSSIWTEKYRPHTFEEVKGQKDIVEKLKAFVKTKEMPHLLFAGPAGVGKTTVSLVIAKELFGENWRANTLELNASDERGIDVVRTKVKDFARTKALGNIPFKLIYLDESDALTKEAQQALRRTMENYTRTVRFILSCVTPDTKIMLSGERETIIDNFIDQYEKNPKEIFVENISDNRKKTKKDLVLAAVKLPASSIGKKVLEISTMTGRKIKVTNDHKLLTTKGWKEAGDITKEDELLIYPNLEGTPVEDNSKNIINLDHFVNFIASTEEKDGLKTINNAKKFKNLQSKEKEKIIKKIKELQKITKSNKGLTPREFEAYEFIKNNPKITRKDLQKKLKITRIGTNYLLPSLVKKGFIKRHIHKKEHSFTITNKKPIVLRNDKDIKKLLEKEFSMNISYTAVRKSIDKNINRGRIDRVIGELTRKKLLNLTYNNIEKIGALARICGFMLGDGHLVHNSIRLHFSGNKKALKEVQKDLEILGYSKYSKIKSIELTNTIMKRTFTGTSTSFTLDSKAFSLLLQHLGITKGDKVVTPYNTPKFIKNGTKFVKREFIRALFACDADKPNWKKMNFQSLMLRQNKSVDQKQNMLNHYNELSEILKEFEIDSYITTRDKKEVRKRDNKAVLTFGLNITPNNKNLFKFFTKIGYCYEKYKNNLARASGEYLRHKLFLIEQQKLKKTAIFEAKNSGLGYRKTAKKLNVSIDFVSNQLKGKEAHLPWKSFMSFDKWQEEFKHNELLLKNKIIDIKPIDEELVMDITCQKDHNFVSNGLISHNCNYSSKILDPIQSRCAVFRFRPLPDEEIRKVINKIVTNEQITITEEAIDALIKITGGDCRKLENVMQSCATLNKNIDADLIYSMSSMAKPKEVKDVLELAANQNFPMAKKKLLDLTLNHGLSGTDIIKQMSSEIWNLDIDDKTKVKLIDKCGEIEFRLVEGSDEYVQLEALLAYTMLICSE